MKKNQFDILIVSLFYLLSRFQKSQSTVKAEHIVEHLEMLLVEPQVEQSPILKNSCGALLTEWRVMVGCHGSSGFRNASSTNTTLKLEKPVGSCKSTDFSKLN